MIAAVVPGILFTFFFNRFISCIENKFKPPRSDRGFLFEGFFQKSLHYHLFLSLHRDFFSEIDIFALNLAIFIIARTFSSSARSFPHPMSLEELLN